MNENIGRWVFATMSGDFADAFSDVQIHVEGVDKQRPVDQEYLEFRMDGPRRQKPSRIDVRYEFEINILVRTYMDSKDFHRMRDLTGRVAEFLAQNHCIYRYGDGPDDDEDEFVGELHLLNRNKSELVKTNHFGQIDQKYRIEEATVEASYKLYLGDLV